MRSDEMDVNETSPGRLLGLCLTSYMVVPLKRWRRPREGGGGG